MSQFEEGESGNKRGRPPGSKNRNKITEKTHALLLKNSEAITQKIIDKALEGDKDMLKICASAILPPSQDRLASLKLKQEMEDAKNGKREEPEADEEHRTQGRRGFKAV